MSVHIFKASTGHYETASLDNAVKLHFRFLKCIVVEEAHI